MMEVRDESFSCSACGGRVSFECSIALDAGEELLCFSCERCEERRLFAAVARVTEILQAFAA